MDEEYDPSPEWRRRAAVLLLSEQSLVDVIADLVSDGAAEEEAAALAAEVLTDPVFEAGKWAMSKLAKLECVLDVRQQMADLVQTGVEVERRKDLSREEFLERYYATNTPVVLEDVCEDWPARRSWSPQYLADRLGSAEVEVMTGRQDGSGSDINLDQYRTVMAFDDYVARVEAIEWSNSLYLVANNQLLAKRSAVPLWKDFTLDKRYMQPDRKKTSTFLWFGPGGTVTSLHHDIMNILFHQVQGWKHFILVAPTETHRLYNRVGVFSDVDPLAPDPAHMPKFAGAHQLQVTVGPGDALFVPVGWWHHVTALETSISISSTSFVYPNAFNWVHPLVP